MPAEGEPWPSFLYALLGTLLSPALRAFLHLRLRRGKEVRGRLGERRGRDPTPRPPGPLLWLHAASVGETISLLPVLRALRQRRPDTTLLVTTGSVTSANLLTRRLAELALPGILHRFVPLDVPAWVARFLDHWRPDAGAFVESELWPNLLAAARTRNLPMLLLNARMSDRSFRGWQRMPSLARTALAAFHAVQARSAADAARLRALGAPEITTPGDLKFAADRLPADPTECARLVTRLHGRPIWLAASTHDGEERIAFAVHRALSARHPGLLTLLAPRHPDRGDAIAALAGNLALTRRSAGENPPDEAGIWLIDTLGELGLCFRLADTVFVGNSLVPGGGHNPLEPARLGCAIATGPHSANFADAMAALTAAGGLATVADDAALTAWVDTMLANPAARATLATAAAGAADRWSALPGHCADALLALAG